MDLITIIETLIVPVIAVVLALATANYATKYQQLKDLLAKLTKMMDDLNAALMDDNVSEVEFQAIFADAVAVMNSIRALLGMAPMQKAYRTLKR